MKLTTYESNIYRNFGTQHKTIVQDISHKRIVHAHKQIYAQKNFPQE